MIKPLRDHLEMTFRASITSFSKNKGKWGEMLAGLSMVLIQEPNREFVTISDIILGLKDYGNGSCRSDQAIKTCMRLAAAKGLFVQYGRKSSKADYYITFTVPGELLNVQQD